MSKKSELKKKIAESGAEIELLEKKRGRSQSALLEAMINGQTPNPTDVEYFRVFSSLIELERQNLNKLKAELEASAATFGRAKVLNN